MNAKLFGGLIAIVLLFVYSYLVWTAAGIVECAPQPECLAGFSDNMASALALIGGLVSALVVAELAIAKPGQGLLAHAFDESTSDGVKKLVQILTFLYVVVWIGFGFYAFWKSLTHTELAALSDLGRSWLGLAVAAAYAFFGIKPE